jgi:hypothetical protein
MGSAGVTVARRGSVCAVASIWFENWGVLGSRPSPLLRKRPETPPSTSKSGGHDPTPRIDAYGYVYIPTSRSRFHVGSPGHFFDIWHRSTLKYGSGPMYKAFRRLRRRPNPLVDRAKEFFRLYLGPR